MIPKFLPGTTRQITFISSGATIDSSSWSVFARAYSAGSPVEIPVITGTLVESGGGHYYASYITPTTPGFYVAEVVAMHNGQPYKKRARFEVGLLEVD